MTRYIKLFGLPRSGTNYVKLLFERNFVDCAALGMVLGNKHDNFHVDDARNWKYPEVTPENQRLTGSVVKEIKVEFDQGKIPCVICIKNPYSWAVSFFKLRKQKDKIAPVWDARFVKMSMNMWIKKNVQWVNDIPKNWPGKNIIIFYDELLCSDSSYFLHIGKYFGLELCNPNDIVLRFEHETLRGNDLHHGENLLSKKQFDYTKYDQRLYREKFGNGLKEVADGCLRKTPDDLKRYVVW